MNGMTPQDFDRRLKEVNSRLWVDHTKIAYPYHKDYPTCGLYYDSKFIMGVPHKFVPEWTVSGADMNLLKKKGRDLILKSMLNKGFIPDEFKETVEERLLWRGYRAILAGLYRLGYIDQSRAEEVFRCEIQPKRMEFPRNFVQLAI